MSIRSDFSEAEMVHLRQTYRKNIAELIKDLRCRDQLTQTQFAEQVGINRSLICQYESGEREPSFESIIKIARYAKLSIDYLLGLQSAGKFDLTKIEESLIDTWRKLPSGTEMSVKKDAAAAKDTGDCLITIKQEVKL